MKVALLARVARPLWMAGPAGLALPARAAAKRVPAAVRRLDRAGPGGGSHGNARDIADLPTALRRFLAHPRPPVLLAAVASVVATRAARGRWRRADAVVALGALVAQPFVEWAIHREILHARPDSRFGEIFWAAAGFGHAQHHADPASLDTMFLRPQEIVPLGAVAVGVALAAPRSVATGAVCVGLGVLAYDWTHFLIHTAYQPRTALYRRTWRNHRLHHYRNERYWLGVTSPVADVLLGTEPARDTVPLSRAAPAR
ncbi:MAG: sterol desaturase family protein [Frankia sp.]